MEEEFVSFLREEPVQQQLRGGPITAGSKGKAGGREAGGREAGVREYPKGLLAGMPKIVWLIVGALLLFGVIFWLYYSRRKQTTQVQKQDNMKVIMGQLKDLQTEMDTLQQKQTAMMGHIRNVASHSQSVETTLSQALADWTKTFDTLRSQIEIVEDDEEAGEDGEGMSDTEAQDEEQAEDDEELGA